MTNSKIKAAQKQGVPNPLEDLLKASKEDDLAGVISALMAVDDQTFEEVKDGVMGSLEKSFSSVAYKNTLAQKLQLMTDIDYQQEKKGYDELKKFIDELEMSDGKKEFLTYLFDNAYGAMLQYQIDPSEHIQVIFKKLDPNAIVPTYAHIGDAGADIYALESVMIKSGETALISTGIALKIPGGYEAQVRPRSGMSIKTKIRVANAPGTIDSNYRGEVKVILTNYGSAPYMVGIGDKIAQLVFNKVPTADFIEGEVDTEENNTRGENGFGSSGANAIEQSNGEIST